MEDTCVVSKFVEENPGMFPESLDLETIGEFLDVISSVHIENFTHDDLMNSLKLLARKSCTGESGSSDIALMTVINRSALDLYHRFRHKNKRPRVSSCLGRLFLCFQNDRAYYHY